MPYLKYLLQGLSTGSLLICLLPAPAATAHFLNINPDPPAGAHCNPSSTLTLSQGDLNTLFHLRFPQSYQSITSRFGHARCVLYAMDYYKLAGSSGWVAIQYSGTRAIGYAIGY